ncbi:PAS domain S-box protein [Paucidesulfovibrio longus]|uniref:PAS domain S-box protein n=1 Tax=Paucidesulfovibrio longus TaxID=889 RepID=UPI0003B62E2A|nr:PAS domain S-box protein [Paucidesulfovibrio longus]
MHELVVLLRAAEEALMGRILAFAERHGYTKYTSSRKEDWRLSVRGLTGALEKALDRGGLSVLSADAQYREDPVAAFGVEEARLHRARGVSLSMFQGLFKYYRNAYLDELREKFPSRSDWTDALSLFFDRLEIAVCSSWVELGQEERYRELQEANRRLTNSKNMYMTLVESFSQPMAIYSETRGLQYSNPAFSRLLGRLVEHDDLESVDLLKVMPWLGKALEEQRRTGEAIRRFEQPLTIGGEQRYFDLSLSHAIDMSGVFSGSTILLDEVTTERRARLAFEQGRRERIGMLDAMPVPVVITRIGDGIIRYANVMAANLIRVSRDDMVGHYAPDFYENPQDRARMLQLLESQGSLRAHEIRLKRGEEGLPCLMSAVRVSHFDEACYLFTLLDISGFKRIEEEVAKLSQALQQSPIAVFVTDREGRIEYVNSTFEALTGLLPNDVLGATPDILKGAQQNNELLDKLWKSLRHGRPWRGEMSIERKNGGYCWVMVHLSPLTDADGSPAHFVAFMEDITKRKMAEGVLQDRLQFIQTLMDAVPTPIFYKNIEGVYQGCNRAFEQYFGIMRPFLIGKTAAEISTEKLAHVYHDKDIQLARRGGVQIYESHARRKDGEIRDVIFHKATYKDSKGNPAGIVGSVTDITERKRAERESRDNEATLRQALTGIRAGILVVDPDRKIIEDVNERALELLGGDRADYRGKSSEVLAWQTVLGKPVPPSRIMEPQSDKEYRLLRSGGSVLPVALSVLASTIRGKPRMLLILFDLSERKNLERQLNLAQKLESVGQLAAGIAHEINTPIQYVSSNLSFLGEAFARIREDFEQAGCELSPLSLGDLEEIPGAVRDAQEGVSRVGSIVQAMRKFSHPGSEEQTPVDVNEAIRNTVTIARNEWKYHAEVIFDLDETLPSVLCVPGDFNQVVLNVLVNAAHAVAEKMGVSGDKGEIRIKTSRVGAYVEIAVSDTGGGIPEENRDKIFDPFFTTKEVGKGTGQGLAITHAIVERHHGEIELRSEVGKGTTFLIRFPLEGLNGEARR